MGYSFGLFPGSGLSRAIIVEPGDAQLPLGLGFRLEPRLRALQPLDQLEKTPEEPRRLDTVRKRRVSRPSGPAGLGRSYQSPHGWLSPG
jgi:hypothetical protein